MRPEVREKGARASAVRTPSSQRRVRLPICAVWYSVPHGAADASSGSVSVQAAVPLKWKYGLPLKVLKSIGLSMYVALFAATSASRMCCWSLVTLPKTPVR